MLPGGFEGPTLGGQRLVHDGQRDQWGAGEKRPAEPFAAITPGCDHGQADEAAGGQAEADQMAEVADHQHRADPDRSPWTELVAPAPPKRPGQDQQDCPDEEVRETHQPGHVDRQQTGQDRRHRQPSTAGHPPSQPDDCQCETQEADGGHRPISSTCGQDRE